MHLKQQWTTASPPVSQSISVNALKQLCKAWSTEVDLLGNRACYNEINNQLLKAKIAKTGNINYNI